MSVKRGKAQLWQKKADLPLPVAFIPRILHDSARKSLIKLFRDSLHLNDQIKYEDKQQKNSIEDDIIEDFQIVSEYVQYLEMWLEKLGVALDDD